MNTCYIVCCKYWKAKSQNIQVIFSEYANSVKKSLNKAWNALLSMPHIKLMDG